MGKDRYLKSWESQFNWLRYDQVKKAMFCITCKEACDRKMHVSSNNNFAREGNTTLKISSLRRHQDGRGGKASEHHRLASLLRLYPMKDPFKAAVKRSQEQALKRDAHKPATKTIFHCVYWLLNNELPQSKYDALIK